MTYCIGLLVREGLVMIADTRTNAGVDNVSIFRKLHVFENPGARILVIASAGNLSVTQAALNILQVGIRNSDSGVFETLETTTTMVGATALIGRALRKASEELGPGLKDAGVDAGVTLLFGGQFQGQPMSLYLIYSAGNSIECLPDAPFLQVGETKYGKPILDRSVTYESSLDDALKTGLISMDSTMRSNLAVGMPLDVLVLPRDALQFSVKHRIEPDEPYFKSLSEQWSEALRTAHAAIAPPPYAID